MTQGSEEYPVERIIVSAVMVVEEDLKAEKVGNRKDAPKMQQMNKKQKPVSCNESAMRKMASGKAIWRG